MRIDIKIASISIRAISVLLVLTFITSQVSASQISSSRSTDTLAASVVSDPKINIGRSDAVRNDIAGKAEPGAIGKGIPLMGLAQGKLPPRATLSTEEFDRIAAKLNPAIDKAIARSLINQNNIPSKHRDRFKQALYKLIDLQSRLKTKAYLFNADIRTPEDYLVGFNFNENIGLSLELINRLSIVRLAQYIFHECVPEKGMIIDMDDHRVVYNEIQSAIFGEDEALALKADLRVFINGEVNEAVRANVNLESKEPQRLIEFKIVLPNVAQPTTEQTPEIVMAQISEGLPIHATDFAFNLTRISRILAENPDQLFFMGIETDIGESQKAQIMPIYKAIDQIENMTDNNTGKRLFPNLIVRRAKAGELVTMVRDLNKEGKLNLNNAFIGARKINVDNKAYDAIKGEGRAWISAIDDSRPGDYLPVFEAITMNMMAYLNADLSAIKKFYDAISDEPIDPGVLQDYIKNRIIYILPKATAFDTKQLRELYELAYQVYIAA